MHLHKHSSSPRRQHRSLAATNDHPPRSLRARLASPGPLFGLVCSTPTTNTVELIAAAGYDYLIVDLDQPALLPATLAEMAVAAGSTGISLVAKVASAGQVRLAVGNAVDGIVFSQMRCPLQAAAAVRDCHHAAQVQKIHEQASHAWLSFLGHAASAAEPPLLLAAIEDRQGVACAPQIAAVEGIDGLMESATALSHALQLPWQTRHPAVRAAGQAVRHAAQVGGKQFCAQPQAPAELDQALQDEVRLFVLGDDRVISRRAMSSQLERYRWRTDWDDPGLSPVAG